MLANKLLSVVIPTYNRADFLDNSLKVHIPLAREHNIQIFIFDNASSDSTKIVVEKWQEIYPLIHYHRHIVNVGPENNFEMALKYPKTSYIWLLGDTYLIPKGGISYVLNIASTHAQAFDALIFNLSEIINHPQKNYKDQNSLLYDLGALMTCLSCLVYSNNLIKKANFLRYDHTFYRHTGIILEYIASQAFSIHWVQKLSVEPLENNVLKKQNWSHTPKAFEIGCRKWTNFIFSLPPSYSIENKMKCLMDFGKVSGLFKLKGLLNMRGNDALNYRVYREYEHLIPFVIGHHKYVVLAISLMPKKIPRAMRFIYDTALKRKI